MILYQIDLSGTPADRALERFWSTYASGEPLDPPPPFAGASEGDTLDPPEPDVKEYAETLVRGVMNGRETLDEVIQKVSQHWRLDRMAHVDRNVLRIGAFELTQLEKEVPRKVAINEAVEIAKRFGSAESSAFINGILDRIGK